MKTTQCFEETRKLTPSAVLGIVCSCRHFSPYAHQPCTHQNLQIRRPPPSPPLAVCGGCGGALGSCFGRWWWWCFCGAWGLYDDGNVDGTAANGSGTAAAAAAAVVLFLGIARADSPRPGARPRFGGVLWLLPLMLRLLPRLLMLSTGPLLPPDLMLGASVGMASGPGAWCWAYAVSLALRLSAASILGFRGGSRGSGWWLRGSNRRRCSGCC